MENLKVSLKPITAEIRGAEKKLKAIKGRVNQTDREEINGTIDILECVEKCLKKRCHTSHYLVFRPLK
jgi:hypothetical protein